MELVAQDDFPAFIQFLLWILLVAARFGSQQHLKPFRFTVQQLQPAVHFLIVSLTGVGSSMVLKV
ncbi:hypothetical protein D3C76_1468580 [compost metagenome]